MSSNRALRLLFSILLLPTGAVLVLIAGTGKAGVLVNGLGLSLIVAGIVAAFRELVIVRFEGGETADQVANRLQERFLQPGSGIRLISTVRRGFDGYYRWAISTHRSELFFAGRSVLHRIQADLSERLLQPVEAVIHRKLTEHSEIRVLFLDPRSDLITRLANEEGQPRHAMLADLARSLGICRRLYERLKQSKLPPDARLHIRVYDEVPHFAYHRDGDDTFVGFYFTSVKGSLTAAFEVIDPDSRTIFEDHFAAVYGRAARARIVEVSPHLAAPDFNSTLYDELCEFLTKELGEERTQKLLAGEA